MLTLYCSSYPESSFSQEVKDNDLEGSDKLKVLLKSTNFNPSNAEVIFVQSTRTQNILENHLNSAFLDESNLSIGRIK